MAKVMESPWNEIQPVIVFSQAIKAELQEDVKDKGFAVLIDEIADVSSKKNLCICK